MNSEALRRNEKEGCCSLNSRRQVREFCLQRFGAASKLIIVLFVLLLLPAHIYPQQSTFFNVKSIINDVQKRFKLTPADLRRLIPLIHQENLNVIHVYDRFGGEELEYSPALWQAVIAQRSDFESRLGAKFTPRLKAALRTARTALEQRILEFVVEDYIDFLAEYLPLDSLEFDGINHLFRADCSNKHQLILKYLSNPSRLQTELEKATVEIETWMIKILPPHKIHLYRLLSAEDIIGY